MRRFLISFSPAILLAIIFTILSAVPGDSIPLPPIWNADKYAHLAVYFIQTFSIILGYRLYYPNNYRKTRYLVKAVFYAITMGGLIEILQEHLFTNRSGDYLDFLANCLGAIIAGTLFYFFDLLKRFKFLKELADKI